MYIQNYDKTEIISHQGAGQEKAKVQVTLMIASIQVYKYNDIIQQ